MMDKLMEVPGKMLASLATPGGHMLILICLFTAFYWRGDREMTSQMINCILLAMQLRGNSAAA